MEVKVIAINGSSRKSGNTYHLIKYIFDIFSRYDINTELVQLAGKEIFACEACFACKDKKLCIKNSDDFNNIFEKMKLADCIILGSPVYSADISAKMKALLDRAAVVSATNPGLFRHKIGASIVAVRRAGGMTAIDSMNHFFLNKEMIIVGSTYWNMVYGNNIGEVLNDDEGIRNMENLANNIIWTLKKFKLIEPEH